MILGGLAALVLLPAAADFVQWSLWRQRLQLHADAAALDGARALRLGEPVVPRARSEIPPGLPLAAPPAIEHPPRGGAYAGRRDAVRVRLTAARAPFFTGRLFGPATMTAQGTAAVLAAPAGGTWVSRVE